MLETIKPITMSIEQNIYMGKYDFSDCPKPIGKFFNLFFSRINFPFIVAVRNFIKIIIINLISVHSELFTINKQLINKVLTYAVVEIYTEIHKLLTTVSSFSADGAMQIYIDIFCLKETLKHYLSANSETEKLVKKILDLIPNSSFQQNKK